MMTQAEQAKSATVCPVCGLNAKLFGRHRNGLQRYRCLGCRKTFTEAHERGFRVEDYLNDPKGIMAIQLLLEGCSVRTVERITGIRRDSVLKLMLIAGERCEALMSRQIRNIPVNDVQADEVWNFIGKKEGHKRTEEENNDSIGDCYTWIAIERHTKLVLAFVVGRRTLPHAMELMGQLRRATSSQRFQLTTDGLVAYVAAVDEMLGDRVEFAQLVKVYKNTQENERRYSPGEISCAVPIKVSGSPDLYRVCTSHVERFNLTLRMGIRGMTRLTNAFSKKLENHKAAIALQIAYYNFCRIHQTLKITPAMEAGITEHIWSITELLQ